MSWLRGQSSLGQVPAPSCVTLAGALGVPSAGVLTREKTILLVLHSQVLVDYLACGEPCGTQCQNHGHCPLWSCRQPGSYANKLTLHMVPSGMKEQ